MQQQVNPLLALWTLATEWLMWKDEVLSGEFSRINIAEVKGGMKKFAATAKQLADDLEHQPRPRQVLFTLALELSEIVIEEDLDRIQTEWTRMLNSVSGLIPTWVDANFQDLLNTFECIQDEYHPQSALERLQIEKPQEEDRDKDTTRRESVESIIGECNQSKSQSIT